MESKALSVVSSRVSPPLDEALARWHVAREVERREHAPILSSRIPKPGYAEVRFKGGEATLRFSFVDPRQSECPDDRDIACIQRLKENPTGFEVISYVSRHDNH